MVDGKVSFSVGMLVRNHEGDFIQGRTMSFVGRVDVQEAELVGILEALKWSSKFQGSLINMESDSLLSVQAIKGSTQNFLETGLLVD